MNRPVWRAVAVAAVAQHPAVGQQHRMQRDQRPMASVDQAPTRCPRWPGQSGGPASGVRQPAARPHATMHETAGRRRATGEADRSNGHFCACLANASSEKTDCVYLFYQMDRVFMKICRSDFRLGQRDQSPERLTGFISRNGAAGRGSGQERADLDDHATRRIVAGVGALHGEIAGFRIGGRKSATRSTRRSAIQRL